MSIFTRTVVAGANLAPVRRTVTGTRAGRALAHRFVAGDTLEDAVTVARRLDDEGLAISLDLLGEEVEDRTGAERAADEYVQALDRINPEDLQANISVKLTQLGLAIDPDMASAAVDRLASAAAEGGTTVTIDMEDSRYTAPTVDIYAENQKRHGNLGLCLQAYLRRTPDDLERLLPLGGHIRLCKGAYLEPADIAHQKKDDIDAAFIRLIDTLMQEPGVRPAIATHDPRLIQHTLDAARHRADGFEFQMLYGVRADEQRRLVEMGHDMRVYLPYGSAWYPYLTRRMAERPANVWFFVRALLAR